MRLDQLLDGSGLPARVLRGEGTASAVEIADLAFDNRLVEPGTLFFCVRGHTADGHDFAPAAVEAGAAALVVDHELDLDVPQVLVADTRRAMAPLAAAFFGEPSRELRMVGVTGTNGKTTTAFLTRTILEAAGMSCGLLGTVKQVVGGVEEPVVRTTPEAIDLQRTFRRMLDAGDRACVIEVSSHALVLGRADAIAFDVAAFTNLTQDHLDFHADMEDYFAAKRLLFEPDPGGAGIAPEAAAINVDDPYGAGLLAELRAAGRAALDLVLGGGGRRRPERPPRLLRRDRLPVRAAHLGWVGPRRRRSASRATSTSRTRSPRWAARARWESTSTSPPRRSPAPSPSRAGWSRSTKGRTSG